MPPRSKGSVSRSVPVVFATTSLLTSASARRPAVLAMVEAGAAAFLASGVSEGLIGPSAPWFVLAAVGLGFALRAVDLETSALFIPGGVYGTVKQALGKPAAKAAASGLLVQHLMLGALGAVSAGRSIAVVTRPILGVGQLPREVAANDVGLSIGVLLVA